MGVTTASGGGTEQAMTEGNEQAPEAPKGRWDAESASATHKDSYVAWWAEAYAAQQRGEQGVPPPGSSKKDCGTLVLVCMILVFTIIRYI